MVFVMIQTTNSNVADCLNHWWNENHQRPYMKKWMISRLGTGMYLFECNNAVLTILLDLKERFNGHVTISIVKPLDKSEFPVEVKKEVELCRKKKMYPMKERLMELCKIRPRYSLNLKER